MNKWQTFGLGMAIVTGLIFFRIVFLSFRHECPSELDNLAIIFFSPCISLCILGIWLLICGKSPNQRNIIRLSFVIGFTTGLVTLVAGVIYSGIFYPNSNQGPLLGYFFTGPIGLAVGIIVGIPIAFIINERKKKLKNISTSVS